MPAGPKLALHNKRRKKAIVTLMTDGTKYNNTTLRYPPLCHQPIPLKTRAVSGNGKQANNSGSKTM